MIQTGKRLSNLLIEWPATALLAFAMMYGLLILQASFYFIEEPWDSSNTITFYGVISIFAFWSAWSRRKLLNRFCMNDALFSVFVLMVIVRLGIGGLINPIDYRNWGFLVLMVVVPFVIGRSFYRSIQLKKLQALVFWAGLAVLPILIVERVTGPVFERERQPIFGMDHGPLLVGALISAALVASTTSIIYSDVDKKNNVDRTQLIGFTLLFLLAAFLVWVSARGWLIAGIVGSLAAAVTAAQIGLKKRFIILLTLTLSVVLSMKILPAIDPSFGITYARLANSYSTLEDIYSVDKKYEFDTREPVLRKEICSPFVNNFDSVAMRLIMYRESIALFQNYPIWGVGLIMQSK